jgi:hypothetical protein
MRPEVAGVANALLANFNQQHVSVESRVIRQKWRNGERPDFRLEPRSPMTKLSLNLRPEDPCRETD